MLREVTRSEYRTRSLTSRQTFFFEEIFFFFFDRHKLSTTFLPSDQFHFRLKIIFLKKSLKGDFQMETIVNQKNNISEIMI
jgi:hypothetical protein